MLNTPLALLLAAQMTAASLTGLTEDAAKEKLGQPDVARREANGALWTYRKADCVLLVYLADKGEGLKVTGLSAGPRRAGDMTPDLATCLPPAKEIPAAVKPAAAVTPAPAIAAAQAQPAAPEQPAAMPEAAPAPAAAAPAVQSPAPAAPSAEMPAVEPK